MHMSKFKRFLCTVLAVGVITLSAGITAGASGTIAYGAGTVNASILNVRSGPGTNYDIISTLSDGTIVVILEQSSSGWYKINYNGTEGYVSAEYLEEVYTAQNFSAMGQVNEDYVRYRTGPSTDYTILGSLNRGTQVSIIGINSGWYKIQYGGEIGYMRSDYVDIISSSSSGGSSPETAVNKPGTVNEDYVRVRTGPSTGYSIITMLNKGTSLTVTAEVDGWYKISCNGITGYMSGQYIDITDSSSSGSAGSSETAVNKPGTVNEDYVRFRTGPSTSYSILFMLNSGTSLDVISEINGWYKVNYNGSSGYMSAQYITVSDGSSSGSNVEAMDVPGRVTENYVRVRTGPSTNYSIITMLNAGTSLRIVGKTDGWYKIEYNGISGYMSADYVTETTGSSSSTPSSKGQEIADFARQYVGYSYVYGGASPWTGFDCSGLMYYVYGQFGYSIQRGAGSQYAYSGVYVDKSELQPGDLVFFSDNGFVSVTHVGMYLGDGQFVHASNPQSGVRLDSLDSSYYSKVYYGAKRII